MAQDSVAILLTPDGDLVEVDLPERSRDRLTVLYAMLRCRAVDVVALTDRLDMWLDDEGLYNHPVNVFATLLARRYGWTHQPYHGPVLLTGGADADGETLPLSRDQVRAVLTALLDTAG